MIERRCKYCGSEMDLMDSEPNYERWICIKENCNATLILDERQDFSVWEKDGIEDFEL